MQCILGTSNPVTMAVRALSLVLLFTFVSFGFPRSTPVPESVLKEHLEEHTLSTELLPPPAPVDEKEHHATIYVINLYAVKNGSSNASEEMFQNEVLEMIPDITEPLVSVLLIVEDDENEEIEKHPPVDLDEFAEGLEGDGFKVDKINLDSKAKVLKMKLEKAEAESMIESALKGNEKKYRQKRTICMKCGGGGGGWGGYPSGGGHYPSESGHYPSGGGGGWGGYPSGGEHYSGSGHCPTCGGGGYPTGGGEGGGHHHHHHGGGYPRGGGCGYRCGGGGGGWGGGGGGGWAHSSASAQASAGSWGKK